MSRLIPPPVVAAVVGLLMWSIHKTLAFGTFASELQKPAALTLLSIGLLLIAVAAGQFIAARTTINPMKPSRASNLVTTGVFAFSRNPIYLGDLLMLAALAVWFGNGVNVVLLFLFVWYINRFQIVPEEQALAQNFGAAYHAYCSRVRRWL
ncbi:MAG: isoprenylcysteine carboxylmethyltransferase family protein [Burkholderiales bacterium]